MLISIAMATYNGATLLQRQLDSILRQTRQPEELVVCDDGSSDETLEILAEFSQSAPFQVNIYRNSYNLGFTKNFEQALRKCAGDLIFLSDQDDVWLPKKIEFVEKVFQQNPDKLLVIHDGQIVDKNLIGRGVTKFDQVISAYGSADSIVTGTLTALRRDLLKFALPVPDRMQGHDVWLHNIARLLDSRCVVKKNLQLIVRHDENTSNWVGSSIKKITKWDLWRSEFRTIPATNYSDRLLINECSQARLQYISKTAVGYPIEKILLALRLLHSEQEALRYRERLVKSNWLKRKVMSIRFFLSGGYRHFNGMRSFLRDLAR